MGDKITPILMFEGNAEEAMKFYTSLFDNSEIKNITRYTDDEQGKSGCIKHALFSLNGQEYRCIDSPVKHGFSFTPSVSLYVACESEAELDRLYKALIECGTALMPSHNYGFSKKFAWVTDRFGVSWQLNFKE